MNNGKKSFLKRVITSVKDFEKYSEFAVENINVAIKYLIKLMCIFVLVISMCFVGKIAITANNAINFIKNNIESISYKDGILTVDDNKNIKIEDEKNIPPVVIIDTTQSDEKNKENIDNINNYDMGVLILSDKIVLKNTIVNENIEYKYTDIAKKYNVPEFDKQGLIDYINNMNMANIYLIALSIIFIYTYVIYFTSTVIDAITLGVLGIIISRLSGIRIKYRALFNMSVYSLTLPIILNLIYIVVNTFTGYTIKYFEFMYTTVSYIYLIVAILMIKADLITTHREVIKIEETQKEVRKQMQEEKDKENEEKKDENDDEQADNVDNKENNKENKNVGDEALDN